MAGIILPNKFSRQPQYRPQVDWSHPALSGVSSSIITYGAANNWTRHQGKLVSQPTFAGTVATENTVQGQSLLFNGTDTYLDYGSENIPTSEFTLLFGGIFDSLSNYRGLVDCTVNGVSGWNIFAHDGHKLWFSVNNYGGKLLSSDWPLGTPVHGALRNKNGVSCDWFRNGVNIATATGAAPGAVTVPFWVGNQRGGGLKILSGKLAYFYLLDKYLDDATISSLQSNPWQLFKAPARRLWAVTASGISLTGASSTQANTSSAAVIALDHALVGAASTQANASSTGAITLDAVDLIDAGSTQGSTGSIGAITQTQILAASSPTQSGTSPAVAITQVHVLSGAAVTQGNTGSAGATSIISEFIGAPSAQANLSGVGQITRTQALTAVNSTQANPSETGVISDGVVVESALTTGIAEAIRIKKPGIPAGTSEWLKTLLEILIGRRGNRIEVPRFQILTFSATPTKTECEALYSYTNTVRDSLEQLIHRMDS